MKILGFFFILVRLFLISYARINRKEETKPANYILCYYIQVAFIYFVHIYKYFIFSSFLLYLLIFL